MIVQGGYNDVMVGTSAAALMASIDGILGHLAARRIKAVLCGFYKNSGGSGISLRLGSWRRASIPHSCNMISLN